jgi:hypothetical protein
MTDTTNKPKAQRAGAFDIRTFIALLLGIYGVVLVVMGLFGTSDGEINRDAGMNVNLLAGIGMLVAAALLQLWALRRPVLVPPRDLESPEEDAVGERPSST